VCVCACLSGVVICLERVADLYMAQLMPLPCTVSCFSKIQIGFTFLVPAYLGSPGQRAVKRVCVCVFHLYFFLCLCFSRPIICMDVCLDFILDFYLRDAMLGRVLAMSLCLSVCQCSVNRLMWFLERGLYNQSYTVI